MASVESSPRQALIVRLMTRIADPSKRGDYLIVGMYCLWPPIYAAIIGAYGTIEHEGSRYVGYGRNPEWMVLIVGLPLTLLLFRWAVNKLLPVTEEPSADHSPGLIDLISPEARAKVLGRMREALLAPVNFWIALGLTAFFHIFDVWIEFLRFYVNEPNPATIETDWAVMFLTGAVGKTENLLLVAFAYLMQVTLLFLILLFIVMAFRHNVFYLDRVYQRRRVPLGKESEYLVIDIDDPDRCFGFRSANEAFNVQVVALMLGGAGLLFSRFPTVTSENTVAVYGVLDKILWFLPHDEVPSPTVMGLLPDFGQWSILVVWLVALAGVSLPALVKLLPRLPVFGSTAAQRNIVGYLREFLPDSHWPFSEAPKTAEVDALAARFAENSFWPTGNNRAKTLFFISFFVGFVLLFPLKHLPGHTTEFVLAYALMAIAALVVTVLAMKLIAWPLSYIDSRLVTRSSRSTAATAPEGTGGPMIRERYPGRIFISYRRDDTMPYAGRLRDTLEEFCHPDRIFRDLETISGGQDFSTAIDEAISGADVVIVLIGRAWLAPGNESVSRLHKADDWVRLEIAAALARPQVQVIPVLVGGGVMPSAEDLPDALKPLSRRHAIEVSDTRWDYDIGQLVRAMKVGVAK